MPEPVTLAQSLPFAVYAAHLACSRAAKPSLDRLGISYTQWFALLALREHDIQTVGQLAEAICLESSTVTGILKNLQKLGMVERKRGVQDERQTFATLTAEGRRIVSEADSNFGFSYTGFGPSQVEDLRRDLVKLSSNLHGQLSD